MIKNCKSGPLLAEVENVVINSVDQLTQVNKNIKGIKNTRNNISTEMIIMIIEK